MHDLVRMGNRFAVTGDAELETGRIQHWRKIVHQRRDGFELLPDAGIVLVPGHVSKNVGGQKYVVGGQPRPRFFKESGNGAQPVLLGIRYTVSQPNRVRETHIIELDLVKAVFGSFHGDVDVVLPDLLVGGVSPGYAFAVAIDLIVRRLY